MLQDQKVSGVIPFKNRNERRELYHSLKQEFGQYVKIEVENGLMFYSLIDKAM